MRVNSAIDLFCSTYFYIDICSIYPIDIQKTCLNNMLSSLANFKPYWTFFYMLTSQPTPGR